jgi:hypothetical protein
MAQLSNRKSLIDYCLRKLGYPVITIQVSDEQISDRIDDAIEYNIDYNYNMVERKYLSIRITQSDIDNNSVTVPEEIIAITRLLPIRTNNPQSIATYLFDINYHVTAQAMSTTYASGDLSQFYLTKQYISTINDVFSNQPMYEFRRYTDRVDFLFSAKDEMAEGDYIVIECHTPIGEDSRFWNDRLLRDYATALIKRQWASNISKYQNIQLPGGVMLNGTELYNQATEEIRKLEQDIQDYSEPIGVIIG